MPYESGMDPIGDARQRFDVRFYLVAIVFLLFDVELLFLYPWAVAQWSADAAGVVATRPGVPVTGIPAEFRGLVFVGDHGLHRDPGGGVRLCLAERGLRMAVGNDPDGRSRPGMRRPTGTSLSLKPAGALEVPENVHVTTLDSVVNWCRKYSLWPMPFATACCGIELMAVGASRFDIARFGAEVMRFSPRQCDLMIVAGRVAMKMMPVLQRIWLQMPEPKWCISMGACASHRRGLRHLRRRAGGRPVHPGRRLHSRLPAPSRADPAGAHGHAGQDPEGRHDDRAPACPSCSSAKSTWPRSGLAPLGLRHWPASAATRTGSAIGSREARPARAPRRRDEHLTQARCRVADRPTEETTDAMSTATATADRSPRRDPGHAARASSATASSRRRDSATTCACSCRRRG